MFFKYYKLYNFNLKISSVLIKYILNVKNYVLKPTNFKYNFLKLQKYDKNYEKNYKNMISKKLNFFEKKEGKNKKMENIIIST